MLVWVLDILLFSSRWSTICGLVVILNTNHIKATWVGNFRLILRVTLGLSTSYLFAMINNPDYTI
jgi:hypothetical protein